MYFQSTVGKPHDTRVGRVASTENPQVLDTSAETRIHIIYCYILNKMIYLHTTIYFFATTGQTTDPCEVVRYCYPL